MFKMLILTSETSFVSPFTEGVFITVIWPAYTNFLILSSTPFENIGGGGFTSKNPARDTTLIINHTVFFLETGPPVILDGYLAIWTELVEPKHENNQPKT